MENFNLKKFLSTGHRYSPIRSHLITIRDTLFKKNFAKLKLNFQSLKSEPDQYFDGLYIEIGVGYTINDLLFFRAKHKFQKAIITDINNILSLRLNCFCLLIDPRNYFHRIFYRNLSLIICSFLLGRIALRIFNIEYRISSEIPKAHNALVFSNAVLEHLEPHILSIFMQELRLNLPHSTCFGIIDANDHLNRNLPLDKQFEGIDRPNHLDVQFRGNGILLNEWKIIFDTYFKDAELKIHEHNGVKLPGIYNYRFVIEE